LPGRMACAASVGCFKTPAFGRRAAGGSDGPTFRDLLQADVTPQNGFPIALSFSVALRHPSALHSRLPSSNGVTGMPQHSFPVDQSSESGAKHPPFGGGPSVTRITSPCVTAATFWCFLSPGTTYLRLRLFAAHLLSVLLRISYTGASHWP
jgi:hypothetical protein